MDLEDFAKRLRVVGTSMPVERVVIKTPKGNFRGVGTLLVHKHELVLDVLVNGSSPVPDVLGTYTEADLWTISGIADYQYPFRSKAVARSRRTASRSTRTHSAEFSLHRVLLQPRQRVTQREKKSADYARAFFIGFKLTWASTSTDTKTTHPFLGESSGWKRDSLIGEIGPFEYCLIQRDSDCELIMRRRRNARRVKDWNFVEFWTALLKAVAFAHGQHAWPQYCLVKAGSRVVEEWATAPRGSLRSKYPPITRRGCANGDSLDGLIGAATRVFYTGDQFAEDLATLLFVAREAGGSKTPHTVGTLSLCSCLEGLINLLAQHHLSNDERDTSFEQVRSTLQDALAHARSESNTKAADRFSGIISSARSVRTMDLLFRIGEHFKIAKSKFRKVEKSWHRQRNPLSHGRFGDASVNDLLDQSRIAGTINMLACCAIGHKGIVPLSFLEDEYVRLSAAM